MPVRMMPLPEVIRCIAEKKIDPEKVLLVDVMDEEIYLPSENVGMNFLQTLEWIAGDDIVALVKE